MLFSSFISIIDDNILTTILKFMNIKQMKRYFKLRMKKLTYRNNPKPTEKLAGPHNERGLPSKNYNRGKN